MTIDDLTNDPFMPQVHGRSPAEIASYLDLRFDPQDERDVITRRSIEAYIGGDVAGAQRIMKDLGLSNDERAYIQGLAELFRGHNNEALNFFTTASRSSNDPEVYHLKGLAQANLGMYSDAIASQSKVLDLDPQIHTAWKARADAYSRLGGFERALEDIDEYLTAQPNDMQANVWRLKYLMLTDPQRVITEYAGVQAKFGDSGELFAVLGYSNYELGNYRQALISFQKIVAREPDFSKTLAKLGKDLTEIKEFEVAIEYFEASKSNDPQMITHKAECLHQIGRDDDALRTIDTLLEESAADDLVWLVRGRIQESLGNLTQARDAYTKAIAISPTPQAYILKAAIFLGEGKPREASRTLSDGLRVFPNEEQLYALQGSALERQHKFREALRCYTQAIEIDPEESAFHISRARINSKMRQFKHARADYQSALELDPLDTQTWFEFGNFLRMRRDVQAMQVAYNHAIDLDRSLIQQIDDDFTAGIIEGKDLSGRGFTIMKGLYQVLKNHQIDLSFLPADVIRKLER